MNESSSLCPGAFKRVFVNLCGVTESEEDQAEPLRVPSSSTRRKPHFRRVGLGDGRHQCAELAQRQPEQDILDAARE
jgi:hypothetical protein